MAAFVQLTDPDGNPTWIQAHWVTQLKLPRGQYHPNTKTIIILGAREQAVCETPEQVMDKLEGHHAPTTDA